MEIVTFRLANYETPLWAVENFSAGRYNTASSGFTQYLSLHPLTPWAEILRSEDRRARERAILMRYPLWAIRVQLDEDPFELTFGNASDFGLSASDLVADDYGPCRALAEGFRSNAPRAFIAPSAALPGTRNLIVLTPQVLVSWNHVPIDDVDWPGSMISQEGRCPEGLWDLVHFIGPGTAHAELEAWEHGADFEFDEPAVSAATFSP
jgi:hypothetical protein